MTFSSWVLVTGGASAPQPSSSTFCCAGDAVRCAPPKGLKPPPDRAGVKTGFDATEGLGPDLAGAGASPAEYFEPDESATFCTMPSGVRSRSERAVI